jgi:peptidoglycan hydrolase-like protein with peptidoglycan-binding domain
MKLMKSKQLLNEFRNALLAATALALVTVPMISRGDEKDSKVHMGEQSDRYSYHDHHLVKQIQTALRRLGYYRGPIDGFASQETQVAIAGFQIDHKLPVRLQISRPLLLSLNSPR